MELWFCGKLKDGSSATADFQLGVENRSLQSEEGVVTVSGTSRLLLG